MRTEGALRQWLASLSCVLSMSMIGTCFVWVTPLMVLFTSPLTPIEMSKTELSWIASVIELAVVVVTIPIGLLTDRFGRKTILLSAGPLVLVCWLLILFTRSLITLFIARIFQGFAMGIGYIVAPIYLAETADPKIRGLLSVQFQTFYYIGTLYAYITGPYVTYDTYNICMSILPLLFMATFASMPESPYYLLMRKQTDKAKSALTWLRGGKNVDKEFNQIKANVEEDMKLKGNWKDLVATKSDRKAFGIVLLVSFIKYMNGMTVISLYITQTLSAQTLGDLPYYVVTIIVGLILIVSTIFAALFSDKAGRRPLLITSTLGSAVFCATIAAYLYYVTRLTNLLNYNWILVGSLISFCFICNIGVGPLMQTIQAECSPSRTRSIGGAVTLMFSSCFAFINIKMYDEVENSMGEYFNFVIFATVSTVGCVLLLIVLPETAGRSLGQIQEELNHSQSNEIQPSIYL